MSNMIKLAKEKLAKLNDKSQGKGSLVNFWRPVEGAEIAVRIVPTEDGDPLKEAFYHYLKDEGGKKTQSVLCPKRNFGENCPVCDLVSKLYKEGDEESIKLAKDLSAKQRFFSPIVVRGEEEQGVKVWGYSKTIYQAILKLVVNPEYGDITSVEDGLDLVVTSGKKPGRLYTDISFTPKRKSSVLSEDKALRDKLINHGTDFEAIFDRKTTSQVADILDKFLNSGADEGGDSMSTTGDADELDSALKDLGI